MTTPTKTPHLTLVRPVDVPKAPLPPIPEPAVESELHAQLRPKVIASSNTKKLLGAGAILANGAAELRPGMSAQSAKAWLRSHGDRLSHMEIADPFSAYAEIADLREAVLGAASELDDAVAKTKANGIAKLLFGEAAKALDEIEQPVEIGAVVEAASWWSQVMDCYELGFDVIAAGWV